MDPRRCYAAARRPCPAGFGLLLGCAGLPLAAGAGHPTIACDGPGEWPGCAASLPDYTLAAGCGDCHARHDALSWTLRLSRPASPGASGRSSAAADAALYRLSAPEQHAGQSGAHRDFALPRPGGESLQADLVPPAGGQVLALGVGWSWRFDGAWLGGRVDSAPGAYSLNDVSYSFDLAYRPAPGWRYLLSVDLDDQDVDVTGQAQWRILPDAWFGLHGRFGGTHPAPRYHPGMSLYYRF